MHVHAVGGCLEGLPSDCRPACLTSAFGCHVFLHSSTLLQVQKEIDLPNWLAYVSSSITFGGGLLGISYGIVSGAQGAWVVWPGW